MRVLIAHNAYLQRGGEDVVVEQEAELLRSHGHDVIPYRRDNREIALLGRLQLGMDTVWSRKTRDELRALMARTRPDVVHVHNTLPLVSPSVYWAANERGTPVVQTLHNFRLTCPQGVLLRGGAICERCVGRLPWRSVAFGCYRESRLQSATIAATLALHRGLGTYRNRVSRYIALSEFCRRKLIDAGLPERRLVVKPNFTPDSRRVGMDTDERRRGGLYVGRMSQEKGIGVLIAALTELSGTRVTAVGGGPLERQVREAAGIDWRGECQRDSVIEMMMQSGFLIMPSICYEAFPMVSVEAFSCGLPLIASRLGSLAEIVTHGHTGLLFDPGSAKDLAQTIAWAQANPARMREMGRNARIEYETKYSPQRNHEMLLEIYEDAVAAARGGDAVATEEQASRGGAGSAC